MKARHVTSAAVVVLLIMGVGTAPAEAQSVITEVPPASVDALASSIVSNDSFIDDAGFVEGGAGTTAIGSGAPLGGFPLSDESYGILTTGDPSLALTANSGNSGVAVSGTPTAGRGGSAFDTTVLNITLTAPAGASCLVFTYRFFSDEAGGPGNGDAFLAQLDSNTWNLTGTSLSRPGDFAATGPTGVQGVGDLALQPGFAAGTTYDAGTGFLDAKTPITPGQHNLFLSIFDAGNADVDSAAFVGRLGFTAEGGSSCRPPGGVRSAPSSPGISIVPALARLPGRAQPLSAGSGAVPRTRIPPNNKFRVQRVIRLADGSLRLRIRVPHRGVLSAAFARRRAGQAVLVRRIRKAVPRKGVYSLRLRPSKAGLERLRREDRARVLVRIRYKPRGGVPLTAIRRFILGHG